MTRSASAAFGHVLDEGRLHLVAELCDGLLAADIVLIGPAQIADRAEIHEADFRHRGLRPPDDGRRGTRDDARLPAAN